MYISGKSFILVGPSIYYLMQVNPARTRQSIKNRTYVYIPEPSKMFKLSPIGRYWAVINVNSGGKKISITKAQQLNLHLTYAVNITERCL